MIEEMIKMTKITKIIITKMNRKIPNDNNNNNNYYYFYATNIITTMLRIKWEWIISFMIGQ